MQHVLHWWYQAVIQLAAQKNNVRVLFSSVSHTSKEVDYGTNTYTRELSK